MLNDVAAAFVRLGQSFSDGENIRLEQAIRKAKADNPWFDDSSIQHALQTWQLALNEESVHNWLESEQVLLATTPKKVGLILAGNIPLVGLHDLLSVLACGHIALARFSSEDTALMDYVISELEHYHPWFKEHIRKTERLNDAEAIIATGSNNSSRYFESYFAHLPHIIRKNRNSLAVLSGSESTEELKALGKDIFTYYGLGCRNITHLLLPQHFSPTLVYDQLADYWEVMNHNKYANNFTYHRALFLLNKQEHLDNNFLLMKEDSSLYSPVGCLNYSYYADLEEVRSYLNREAGNIQAVVSTLDLGIPVVAPGKSQEPALNDYADNINTLQFCMSLN